MNPDSNPPVRYKRHHILCSNCGSATAHENEWARGQIAMKIGCLGTGSLAKLETTTVSSTLPIGENGQQQRLTGHILLSEPSQRANFMQRYSWTMLVYLRTLLDRRLATPFQNRSINLSTTLGRDPFPTGARLIRTDRVGSFGDQERLKTSGRLV